MMIEFCWDDDKNNANRKKHGIWFEEALSVFDDIHGRLFLDSKHSDDEDSVIRIISARKATKKERVFYEKGI